MNIEHRISIEDLRTEYFVILDSYAPRKVTKHSVRWWITFTIPFYRISGTLYAIWFMPEPDDPKPKKPSPFDLAYEILELMDANGWNQTQAAKHMGISRSRVTQILNVFKIPDAEIDRMKKDGSKITERRLRNLKLLNSSWILYVIIVDFQLSCESLLIQLAV